jgi:NTP pyrophosphatase (non-canonical NTP hydrolase)
MPGEGISMQPQMDNLTQLTHRLRDFAAARDWEKFHSPKNLAMAITAEAGELAAEFQWLDGAASAELDSEHLARVRSEMADVLTYLIRLADCLEVDLVAATNEKIDLNEVRYPAERVRGSAAKYDSY